MVDKVPESHTRVKVQISYQKMTLVKLKSPFRRLIMKMLRLSMKGIFYIYINILNVFKY